MIGDKMSKKTIVVGLIIADKDEYIHIENAFSNQLKCLDFYGLKAHEIIIEGQYSNIVLKSVCCGIGKVNAAVATSLLAKDCDILINAGLSGGFGDAKKYDIVVGTEFVEHDFDLTGIGYKLSQKPGQNLLLKSDEHLNMSIKELFPFVKFGLFATGDSFVSTADKHEFLSKEFSPIACDMESAAFAWAATLCSVPFVSIRMVSDGADDNSPDSYSDTLKCEKSDGWFIVTLNWIKSLR